MLDKFHQLINNLAEKLEVELQVDKNNACTIVYDEVLPVQLELDELEENLIIENWLSQRLNGTVKILIPKQGEKKKQIDMCLKNARYLLEELKLQRMKSKEQTPYILKALQRDLKLKKIPKPPMYTDDG